MGMNQWLAPKSMLRRSVVSTVGSLVMALGNFLGAALLQQLDTAANFGRYAFAHQVDLGRFDIE